jgi:hypothetical protein
MAELKNNFFSKEEIDKIKFYVNTSEYIFPNPVNGNIYSVLNLNKDILQKVNNAVNHYSGKQLQLSEYIYARYTKTSGADPVLSPHIDFNETEYIFDYQLDGNINWPVYVEGQKYYLEDNSGVIFNSKEEVHWRPKRTFTEKDSLGMMYFHFVDPTGKKYSTEELNEKSNSIPQEYWDIYEKEIAE